MLCEIRATVLEAHAGNLKVQTEPSAACSACGGKMFCGSSGKVLNVKGKALPGDAVVLRLPFRSGFMISFLLYMLGTVIAIAVAALIYAFADSEMIAAIAFIVSIALWFLAATVFLTRYVAGKIEVVSARRM